MRFIFSAMSLLDIFMSVATTENPLDLKLISCKILYISCTLQKKVEDTNLQ